MSRSESRSGNFNDELIEFLAEHYASFVFEDKLFKALKDGGIEAVYATHNEPVRLGAFRVLLNEVHKRVHGNLYFEPSKVDLALHGILRENLKIRGGLGREPEKSYHVGIDYVFLGEYPTRDRSRKVVVPLFVIGKSELEEVREVKIEDAIKEVLNVGGIPKNIGVALENLPRFTRILLTRTVISKYEEVCVAGEVGKIRVYSDIACGILYAIYLDIPLIYSEVVRDDELARLTLSDWLAALICLGIPISQVVIASSDTSPESKDGGLINDIVKEVYQRVKEIISEELEKHIQEASGEASQRLQKVGEQLRRGVEGHGGVAKRSRTRQLAQRV